MFRLDGDNTPGRDISCPTCGKGYQVIWETEYGDASIGQHEVTTPCCKVLIAFQVSLHYSQYTKGPKGHD